MQDDTAAWKFSATAMLARKPAAITLRRNLFASCRGIAVQEIHAANVERIGAGPLFHRLDTGREHARDMVKGGMGRMLMLDNTTERDDFRECFGL